MKKRILVPLFAAIVATGGCGWLSGSGSTKKENIAAPKELVELAPTLSVKEAWSRGIGKGAGKSGVRMRPTLVDGKLYTAGLDGDVRAFDAASGREIWKKNIDFRLTGGPGVAGDLLVVGGLDGDVIAFDAHSGTERWKTRVSAEVVAAPAVGQGTVYVRSNDGRVYALDASDGKQRWIYDRATVPLLSLRGNGAPLVVSGDAVLSGSDAGRIVALRTSDGAAIWEQPLTGGEGRTELERLSDIDGELAVDGDVVYAAAYRAQVAALSVTNGRQIWARTMSSYTSIGVSASQVYAVDADSAVWALDRTTGSSMWKQDALEHRWLSGPAVQGDYLVVGDLEGYVHWLSITDGKIVARERLSKKAIQATPVVLGDLVIVEDIDGKVAAYRAAL
jgi:outer membrane protein assembly factor BamB